VLISNWFYTCYTIGHSIFEPTEVKPAWCQLGVITSSSDKLTGLSVYFVIGESDYFVFGFTKFKKRALNSQSRSIFN